jgi:hypothetical protein
MCASFGMEMPDVSAWIGFWRGRSRAVVSLADFRLCWRLDCPVRLEKIGAQFRQLTNWPKLAIFIGTAAMSFATDSR